MIKKTSDLVEPLLDLPFELSPWRLIIEDEPRSAAANMAVDQAIAEACAVGDSLPTVRLYRWQPPAVSIGRHQAFDEIDHDALNAQGFELVRRSTGGRAILHIDELTYSVAAPKSEPRVQGSVMDAYLRISDGLVAGLQKLNINAVKAESHRRAGKDVSAACFEVPSAYEIMVNGQKLLGSAQSRRAGYVLQHGSLPLTGDITRLLSFLKLDNAKREQLYKQLSERACTLAQALGIANADPEPQQLFSIAVDALSTGIAETLNLDFSTAKKATLTQSELKRAALLIREKYANDDWTMR